MFNLVRDPWVPILGPGGFDVVSLGHLFDPAGLWGKPVTLVDGERDVEPLTGAACFRLLLAIRAAAAQAGVEPVVWLGDHEAQFDLFDPVAPFGQCGAIRPRAGEVAIPATMLPLFTATKGATLLDHTIYDQPGYQLSYAEAARLMLVRMMVGTAQRQPFKAALFGPEATFGKNTVCLTRPLLWVETGGSLADDVEVSSTPGLGVGRFLWSWPDGWTPGQPQTPQGPLEVLTWPSRAMLLLDDGDGVSQVAYGNGAVWDDTDPGLQPNMLCYPDAKTPGRLLPVRATVSAGWTRRLLTGWLAGEGGLVGKLRGIPAEARDGWVFRWTGLVADKGRVDAAMEHRFPVPMVPDETLTGWLAGVSATYTTLLKRTRKAVGVGFPLGDSLPKVAAAHVTDGLGGVVDSLSAQVAAGSVTTEVALARLAAHGETLLGGLAAARFHHLRRPDAALPLGADA